MTIFKTISRHFQLGHSNIAITLEIYSHLLDEHKKEQGQKVRELFS